MGRTLDVLLGRTTKQTARLKSILGLAVTRLGVLRGHRQVRCAQARGDVEQLLRLGHPDRALLRAEQVIREQNTLDAFLMLESYCNLITERAALVDSHRECPEELREAAAGLIYAAARCGDVPELQEVKRLMTAKFGREFVSAAAELRSGCGINAKIVQKLSTKQPSLESRQMVLQEIAEEKGIAGVVHVVHDPSSDEDSSLSHRRRRHDDERHRVHQPQVDLEEEGSSRYRNVEAAAQAAFESAATAAAAAKAAMELSRGGESRGPDDDRRRPGGVQFDRADEETFAGGEVSGDGKKPGRIRRASLGRNYSSEIEVSAEDDEAVRHDRRRPGGVQFDRADEETFAGGEVSGDGKKPGRIRRASLGRNYSSEIEVSAEDDEAVRHESTAESEVKQRGLTRSMPVSVRTKRVS